MKKISDRERALEYDVWVGKSVVSRSDYLARMGLKAALATRDGASAERKPHHRSVYSLAILLFSVGAISVLALNLIPALKASCWFDLCHGHGTLAELVGIRK